MTNCSFGHKSEKTGIKQAFFLHCTSLKNLRFCKRTICFLTNVRKRAWTNYLKMNKSEIQQTEQEVSSEKVKHGVNDVANKVIQYNAKIKKDGRETYATRIVLE